MTDYPLRAELDSVAEMRLNPDYRHYVAEEMLAAVAIALGINWHDVDPLPVEYLIRDMASMLTDFGYAPEYVGKISRDAATVAERGKFSL